MHSKIYQIAEQPIDPENYITESDFYENSSDFADYVADMDEEDQEECIADLASGWLEGIFEVNGRELTVLDSTDFLNEWAKEMRELTEELTMENVMDNLYKIRSFTERTHRDIHSRFVLDGWSAPLPETFADFVLYARNFEPGKKLYVGGVVDFHW